MDIDENRFHFRCWSILEYIFPTSQSIFKLWILNPKSFKIIKFESDLMTLNMMFETKSFHALSSKVEFHGSHLEMWDTFADYFTEY
jgi:hypothetical protein